MDLKKYIDNIESGKYMDPKLVKSYLYQINEAILFCHQRRVIHRDLKPQNLLISKDGLIKVSLSYNKLLKSDWLLFLGRRFWFGKNIRYPREDLHSRSCNSVV